MDSDGWMFCKQMGELCWKVATFRDVMLLSLVVVSDIITPYADAVFIQSFWSGSQIRIITLALAVFALHLVISTYVMQPMYMALEHISSKAEYIFTQHLTEAVEKSTTEHVSNHRNNISAESIRTVGCTVKDVIYRIPRWAQQWASMVGVMIPVCWMYPIVVPVFVIAFWSFYELVLRKRVLVLSNLYHKQTPKINRVEKLMHELLSHILPWKINGLLGNAGKCLSSLQLEMSEIEYNTKEYLEYTFYLSGVFLLFLQTTTFLAIATYNGMGSSSSDAGPPVGLVLMLLWQMTQSLVHWGNFTLITVRDLYTRWIPSMKPVMEFFKNHDVDIDCHVIDIGEEKNSIGLQNIYMERNGFVVHGENVNLEYGGVYVLVGKNGDGKSTVLNIVLGVIHAPITFNVNGVVQQGRLSDKNRLAITQGEQLVQVGMSVMENFKFFCCDMATPNITDDDVEFWMGIVGLGQMNRTEPLQGLSGGQNQRMTIALVLCKASKENTPIVILDEANSEMGETDYPFSGILEKARERYSGIILATVHSESVKNSIRQQNHYKGDIKLKHGHITTCAGDNSRSVRPSTSSVIFETIV